MPNQQHQSTDGNSNTMKVIKSKPESCCIALHCIALHCINQSINQSIKQPTNQPTKQQNQSIYSINHLIKHVSLKSMTTEAPLLAQS